MKAQLESLIMDAIKKNVSDIHFLLRQDLTIQYRQIDGIKDIKEVYSVHLFEYLKYVSDLDISGKFNSQSGSFEMELNGKMYFFRFSYIQHFNHQSAVLRILNNHPKFNLDTLIVDKYYLKTIKSWCKKRTGFVLVSGPTGSGKSTLLHIILEKIAENKKLKVITLEDPIEIHSESYLQMQINEKINFTYAEGIKHLLRQDPDIIMIGEIRDENTAKMAFRAALSGHMVFSTIHAKSCSEAIKRFVEFGIPKSDIEATLTGVTNQRLFKLKGKNQKIVALDLVDEFEINALLHNQEVDHSIFDTIRYYFEKGLIKKQDVEKEFSL